jgi:hypothetical protein
MIITDYRVKSVLRTYTKQLQRSKLPSDILPKTEGESAHLGTEKVVISEEARQRFLREQLVRQALSKLEQEKNLNEDKESEKTEEKGQSVELDGEASDKPENINQGGG